MYFNTYKSSFVSVATGYLIEPKKMREHWLCIMYSKYRVDNLVWKIQKTKTKKNKAYTIKWNYICENLEQDYNFLFIIIMYNNTCTHYAFKKKKYLLQVYKRGYAYVYVWWRFFWK